MSTAAGLLLQPGLEPVPGYSLIRRLGGGGFGEVWKARGPGGIEVALKFINLEDNAGANEQRALAIIRAIRHPNLLTPTAAWTLDQVLVLAMELADGTLLDRLRQVQEQGLPGIPRDELHEYMHAAACGLDHLNQRKHKLGDKEQAGVQHRDVKPQNILLVGGGVKVADFGLARVLEKSKSGHSGSMSVAYAAPEFFQNQTSEHSDQYCLAVTYCELRTGKLPFDADSLFAIMQQHLHDPPQLSLLPDKEQPVVARALLKAPKERWPSCRAFVEALRATKSAERIVLPDTLPVVRSLPTYVSPATGMQFVLIPAGSFWMGSPDSDTDASEDEKPQHRVEIDRSFYLSKCPVTRGQFRQFVEETGYKTDPEKDGKGGYGYNPKKDKFERKPEFTWRNPGFVQTDEHPLLNVSWNDALAFCAWLKTKDGKEYILPTEAQWEYACRAGTTTRYCGGDDLQTLTKAGHFAEDKAEEESPGWRLLLRHVKNKLPGWTSTQPEGDYLFTVPVGKYEPNAWGLHDMHGNVWEWCQDWYDKDYYKKSPIKDPINTWPSIARTLRGGSCINNARSCRAAVRSWHVSGAQHSFLVGIRVSFSPD